MPQATSIFSTIARQLRRALFRLSDKPSAKVDENVLEHFLLYHNLVGSSPENQKEFRQVRADIFEAVEHESSAELCAALKLPPLWWEDKLAPIFMELSATHHDRLLSVLCPDRGAVPDECDPLRHESWQVRANAANALATIEATTATERLDDCLKQSATTAKAAFCHIAYSLSRLSKPEPSATLVSFLGHDEHWFRVDAARALSTYPLTAVAPHLMRAMLNDHSLSDYMAVAIARTHKPSAFLQDHDPTVRQGGLEIVIQLLKASTQTFSDDIILETHLPESWPYVFDLHKAEPSARSLLASILLAGWLDRNFVSLPEHVREQPGDLRESLKHFTQAPDQDAIESIILPALLHAEESQPDSLGQARHALYLAGKFKVAKANDHIKRQIRIDAPLLNHAIEAAGLIGNVEAAPSLVGLAHGLVSLEERTLHPPEKHPVQEDFPEKARSYWLILRALGNLPHPTASGFLLEATRDFAPDKREQALLSLLSAAQTRQLSNFDESQIWEAIERGLKDPSAPVKVAALQGFGHFPNRAHLDRVVRLLDAKEVSISHEAFSALHQAARKGLHKDVLGSVTRRARREQNRFRREKLDEFVALLGRIS